MRLLDMLLLRRERAAQPTSPERIGYRIVDSRKTKCPRIAGMESVGNRGRRAT
jgi:hypothetical protein